MKSAALLPMVRGFGLAALALAAASGAVGAQGLGETFTGLQVSGDQPISIESNQLDVDDNKAVATFSGDVAVSQGEMLMRTGNLVVHYVKGAAGESGEAAASAVPGGSGQIERLEATGKVYIKSQDQIVTAESASFDMQSQLVVMNGDVVLSQGTNVATGCRLTIQMDTGVARLESGSCGGGSGGGRVKMMLTPPANTQ